MNDHTMLIIVCVAVNVCAALLGIFLAMRRRTRARRKAQEREIFYI